MIENVSTQLTVFHCLCPLPASRKGLRLTLCSAIFGEGGRDWRPWFPRDNIRKTFTVMHYTVFEHLDAFSTEFLVCIILYTDGKQFKCNVFTFVQYIYATLHLWCLMSQYTKPSRHTFRTVSVT